MPKCLNIFKCEKLHYGGSNKRKEFTTKIPTSKFYPMWYINSVNFIYSDLV